MENLPPTSSPPSPLSDQPRSRAVPVVVGLVIIAIIVGILVVILSDTKFKFPFFKQEQTEAGLSETAKAVMAEQLETSAVDTLTEEEKTLVVESLAEAGVDTLSEEEKQAVTQSLSANN